MTEVVEAESLKIVCGPLSDGDIVAKVGCGGSSSPLPVTIGLAAG